MLWLAYDIWRAKDQAEAEFAAESPMTTYVARGFLTNVLNPKAAVFFIAVLPQFIDPQHDTLRQTLRLSVAYAIVATFVHAVIVLLATYARPFFQNAARMNALRRVLALGLVAVAFGSSGRRPKTFLHRRIAQNRSPQPRPINGIAVAIGPRGGHRGKV